ncbi:MAG: CaiB/BaiF CoA transferase family protein [Halanaeroarchaeum sp.]
MRAPLDGIRVLDLGQIYQGGYAGLLLSYLGADVIKIEPPWGENVRTRTEDGKPPQFQMLNATKRSVTLDLKSDDGKDALLDLVEKADVLFENFSQGKMEDLGLGYDVLSGVNPQLIYGHGSGYGDTGPYADYPAMDLTIQAMSGVMETTGRPDGPPTKAGPAVADFIGAVHLVAGITSALYKRERTGEGEYIDVGMFDTIYPTLTSPISAWARESDAPPRTGNRHSGLSIAPYNAYEVEDGYVAIICVAERHWESLAREMDREDLIGVEKYSSKAKRAEHMEEIDGMIEDWLEGRKKDEVVERLLDANVPTAEVQTIEDIVTDDQLAERGMLNYLDNMSEGKEQIPVPGMPIKFENGEEPTIERAPELGEHTDEVLSQVAGYDTDRIDDLTSETVSD